MRQDSLDIMRRDKVEADLCVRLPGQTDRFAHAHLVWRHTLSPLTPIRGLAPEEWDTGSSPVWQEIWTPPRS